MNARGYVSGPEEGEARLFGPCLMVTKVAGEVTHGQLALLECTAPAGARVHPHRHAGEDEVFYLLEGELEVDCGPDRWIATPGSLVFLPRDVEHRFSVRGAAAARFLIVVGPARFDREVAQGTLVRAGP
jgi:quercetin dioxygenase-like cupin family protein